MITQVMNKKIRPTFRKKKIYLIWEIQMSMSNASINLDMHVNPQSYVSPTKLVKSTTLSKQDDWIAKN